MTPEGDNPSPDQLPGQLCLFERDYETVALYSGNAPDPICVLRRWWTWADLIEEEEEP